MNPDYIPLDATSYGWKYIEAEDNWEPIWYEGNPLPNPEDVLDNSCNEEDVNDDDNYDDDNCEDSQDEYNEKEEVSDDSTDYATSDDDNVNDSDESDDYEF